MAKHRRQSKGCIDTSVDAWSLDIFSVTEFRGEGPNRGRDNTEWVVESVPQLNAG